MGWRGGPCAVCAPAGVRQRELQARRCAGAAQGRGARRAKSGRQDAANAGDARANRRATVRVSTAREPPPEYGSVKAGAPTRGGGHGELRRFSGRPLCLRHRISSRSFGRFGNALVRYSSAVLQGWGLSESRECLDLGVLPTKSQKGVNLVAEAAEPCGPLERCRGCLTPLRD